MSLSGRLGSPLKEQKENSVKRKDSRRPTASLLWAHTIPQSPSPTRKYTLQTGLCHKSFKQHCISTLDQYIYDLFVHFYHVQIMIPQITFLPSSQRQTKASVIKKKIMKKVCVNHMLQVLRNIFFAFKPLLKKF